MFCVATEKAELRRRLRARRATRGTQELQSCAEGLCRAASALRDSLVPGSPVAGYLPFGSEPPLLPLLTELSESHPVLVPVCRSNRTLAWVHWKPGADLIPGSLPGLLEPLGEQHGTEALIEAELVLIPALAVSEDGLRLGQGGGYYDRFLADLPEGPLRCAVTFEDELLPTGAIPTEPWDERVGQVLCPAFSRPLPREVGNAPPGSIG